MLGKFLVLTSFVATYTFANITMCYKENISSPSRAESAKLDGGECAGKYSVKEMQANGWSIKDVIFSRGESGLNYTYSFEKGITDNQINAEIQNAIIPTAGTSKEELRAKIKSVQEEMKKEEEAQAKLDQIERGKNLYTNKCASCHGVNGEKEPHTSLRLQGMSSNEFEASMRDYALGDKDNGTALLMKPYLLLEDEYVDVSKYLQSINVLEKSKEE